jgi:hypothetical protein
MIYKIIIWLTIIFQVTSGQVNNESDPKPFSFVASLFSKDNYTAEFLDFEFPKDVQEILIKFQKSVTEKKEWFQDYFSRNYKAGEGLPYDENFGITKDEYQKIKDLEKAPPNIVVKSKSLIKVVRSPGGLSFKADDNATKFIEALKIDFKNEILTFMNDTIPFSTEINAAASTPFGQWHGYSWKKENSNLGEKDESR